MQRRADDGEEQEPGRRDPAPDRVVRVAPARDHEPHRDQRELEEHEEQQQVEGAEHPESPRRARPAPGRPGPGACRRPAGRRRAPSRPAPTAGSSSAAAGTRCRRRRGASARRAAAHPRDVELGGVAATIVRSHAPRMQRPTRTEAPSARTGGDAIGDHAPEQPEQPGRHRRQRERHDQAVHRTTTRPAITSTPTASTVDVRLDVAGLSTGEPLESEHGDPRGGAGIDAEDVPVGRDDHVACAAGRRAGAVVRDVHGELTVEQRAGDPEDVGGVAPGGDRAATPTSLQRRPAPWSRDRSAGAAASPG